MASWGTSRSRKTFTRWRCRSWASSAGSTSWLTTPRTLGRRPWRCNIRGAIPISGVYRIGGGKGFTKIFGDDPEGLKKASPITHVNSNHPPFLILYADKDFKTCDAMSQAMFHALEKHKIEAALLEIKDRDHISIIRGIANENDPATQAILKFIANHADLKLTAK